MADVESEGPSRAAGGGLVDRLPVRGAFVAFLCVCTSVPALSWGQYRLVGVADGDTLTLLTDDKTQHKIRLHGIDAPEKGQPFGTAAKTALSKLVGSQRVRVETSKKDKYGREIGRVFAGDVDVNLSLLEQGVAWHYTEYDHSPAFRDAAGKAKKSKLGLWSDAGAIPPWEWRKMPKEERKRLGSAAAVGSK